MKKHGKYKKWREDILCQEQEVYLSRREKNLIKVICRGDVLYTSFAPKITRKEVDELRAKGFLLLDESVRHEPTMIYTPNLEEFREYARKLGVID